MTLTKFKCYFRYTVYPRDVSIKEGDFAIAKIAISDPITGPFILNKKTGKPKLKDITIKGKFGIDINPGQEYTVMASIDDTDKYGSSYILQYVARSIDLNSIKNPKVFLKSVLLDDKLVEDIFATLPDPIEVFQTGNIEELCKVKGIGEARALKLLQRCSDNLDYSEANAVLLEYGFTKEFIKKICIFYGNPERAIRIIKENPYRLMEDVDGIGFKKADLIALKMGLDPKCPERIRAYILFYLNDQADNFGNSYVTAGELNLNILQYFGGPSFKQILEDGRSNIQTSVDSLVEEGKLTIEDGEPKSRRRVYLTKIYNLELNIAKHLMRLASEGRKNEPYGWEERVKIQEKIQGYTFDEAQWKGIAKVLKSPVSYITGYAGTGKSSVVAGVLAALGPETTFAQCALAGKAAARLQEVTSEKGQTIHRLLGYDGDGFIHNEYNPLEYDVIILDELSLVYGELFLSLLKAISNGTKLIMLGDNGQLPSIGKLNLATDIFESPTIPTVSLTKIHRQGAESGITTCSIEIRNGLQQFQSDFEGDMLCGVNKDMTFSMDVDGARTLDRTLDWFEKLYNGDPLEIQVLSPVRDRGEACVKTLNQELREIANPVASHDGEFFFNGGEEKRFYIKDKVMVIKNNYHTKNIYNSEVPIFNGWTGLIENIDKEQNLYVYFPIIEDTIILDRSEAYLYLELGYACTVHKSQGSDIPIVIGAIDYDTPPSMLNRSLVYTLITRAKKNCILVGQSPAINKAIATDVVNYKRTFLPELLEKYNKKEG